MLPKNLALSNHLVSLEAGLTTSGCIHILLYTSVEPAFGAPAR